MSGDEVGGVPDEWLTWMREFRALAERLVHEDAIDVESADALELLSIKLALYARIVTVFGTLVLLAENDLQLDLRIHSRAVVEAAIYMIALDRDPSVVDRMKDDDLKSRRERAKLHREAMPSNSDLRKLLDGFLNEPATGLKSVDIKSLVKDSDYARLYHSYRDISGDAAHVSLTSLSRHVSDEENGTRRVLLNPALDRATMLKTLSVAAIASIIATYLLMKCKVKTETWDELTELVTQYRVLSSTAYK